MRFSPRWLCLAGLVLAVLFLGVGCTDDDKPNTNSSANGEALFPLAIQSDWYAQAEHGGFHYGVATGMYEAAGLDVTILTTGPGSSHVQKVARGDAQFGMFRFDSLVQAIGGGMPVVAVAATMRHDPGAIMVHEDFPVYDFPDLEGQKVMLIVGSVFERYIRHKFGVEYQAKPFTWGYGEFMVQRDLVQQCYITNEPYFVEKEGFAVRTIPLYQTGFDPFRSLYMNKAFGEAHPEIARTFVQVSLEAWKRYISEDPTPAFASIRAMNPRMQMEHLRYAHQVLIDRHFFLGEPDSGWEYGTMPSDVVESVVTAMHEIDVLSTDITAEMTVDRSFLGGAN